MGYVGNVRDKITDEMKHLFQLDDGQYVVRNPSTRSAHRYDGNRYEVAEQQQVLHQEAPQNPYSPQPQQVANSAHGQMSYASSYASSVCVPPPMQYAQASGGSSAGISAQRTRSQLQIVRQTSANLPETNRIEIHRQENEYAYRTGNENECIADEGAVMAEGVAGCIAICGIGYLAENQPYHAIMHCGANALSTEEDAKNCLRTVMQKLRACAHVRLYLVGGDDEGESDAANLLAHKDHYPIAGAKVCFSPGSGAILSVDVVIRSGRIFVYGKHIPAWVA